LHRGPKISTKDPRENLKNRSSPPPKRRTPASDCDGTSGDALVGDEAHEDSNGWSEAAAERQPYCLLV
jgi:hypothetical protein